MQCKGKVFVFKEFPVFYKNCMLIFMSEEMKCLSLNICGLKICFETKGPNIPMSLSDLCKFY